MRNQSLPESREDALPSGNAALALRVAASPGFTAHGTGYPGVSSCTTIPTRTCSVGGGVIAWGKT